MNYDSFDFGFWLTLYRVPTMSSHQCGRIGLACIACQADDLWSYSINGKLATHKIAGRSKIVTTNMGYTSCICIVRKKRGWITQYWYFDHGDEDYTIEELKEMIKTTKPMTADQIIARISSESRYGTGSDGISVVDLDD